MVSILVPNVFFEIDRRDAEARRRGKRQTNVQEKNVIARWLHSAPPRLCGQKVLGTEWQA
jgi:hypothetical protein